MSWQATAWAERQVTGHPSRKALLLVLANYADDRGISWPSQETIANGAELSVDTVQRQSRKLAELGLVTIKRLPKRRGQWQGFCYQLNLSIETRPPTARPQNAAWSPADLFLLAGESTCSVSEQVETQPPPPSGQPGLDEPDVRPGQAAELAARPGRKACGATGPQSLRHKPSSEPSIEPSLEPSGVNRRDPAADRLRAFQGKQEGSEVLQNRIAQRLGPGGWLILGEMTDAEREKLTTLQRRGNLDDETLANAARVAMSRAARADKEQAATTLPGRNCSSENSFENRSSENNLPRGPGPPTTKAVDGWGA